MAARHRARATPERLAVSWAAWVCTKRVASCRAKEYFGLNLVPFLLSRAVGREYPWSPLDQLGVQCTYKTCDTRPKHAYPAAFGLSGLDAATTAGTNALPHIKRRLASWVIGIV